MRKERIIKKVAEKFTKKVLELFSNKAIGEVGIVTGGGYEFVFAEVNNYGIYLFGEEEFSPNKKIIMDEVYLTLKSRIKNIGINVKKIKLTWDIKSK